MKSIKTILAVGSILAASSTFAFADPVNGTISMAGDSTYNKNTNVLSFVDGITGGVNYGTFSSFSHDTLVFPGSSSTTNEQLSYGSFKGPQVLFSATSKTGETFTYTLTGVSSYSYSNGLEIIGTGYFTETCSTTASATCVNYTQSNGNFDLTSQGSGNGSMVTTFSNTQTAVTPEPNSLILLGTGLVSAAGVVLRKRRAV